MKASVMAKQEIEVTHVRVTLPVRYEQEDMPNDFPMRSRDQWKADICVDTGTIVGWPEGRVGEFYMKVTDMGIYTLLGPNGNEIASINEDYVPHGLIPGEYGDYVDFKIDETGRITNWPKHPKLCDFFPDQDD